MTDRARVERTPVLVAGGGPAGLAAAAELGLHGVACVLIEPRAEVSHRHPRAKTTSILRIPLALAQAPASYPWRAEFLLVRPDQDIAWRAGDPAGIDLETAAGFPCARPGSRRPLRSGP
jgi:cation diffusion facilitator CzcD-associated flavoprotein CzcO